MVPIEDVIKLVKKSYMHNQLGGGEWYQGYLNGNNTAVLMIIKALKDMSIKGK